MYSSSSRLTEDSLATPVTHVSCATRLASRIENDLMGDLVEEADKLRIPCLTSCLRNRKTGSEREC